MEKNFQKLCPGLVSYKGIQLIKHVHEESYLDMLQDFQIRDSDVFDVTYPKSGTTWLQYILALIVRPDELEGEDKKHTVDIVPWIEVKRKTTDFNTIDSPRLFATHLLPNLLPPGLRRRGKVIYLARNPKDVACSFYHFHKISRFLEDKKDFNTFLDDFFEGKVFGGSWFDHVKDWYSQKVDFNILLITYEEMKKDLKGTVVKISTFLNLNLDDITLSNIVEKSTFSNMQKTPNANLDTVPGELFDHSKGKMLRKGTVGDWKTLFTVAQSERFDRIYKERMTVRIVYHISGLSWYAFVIMSMAAKDGEKLPPGIFEYGGPWKYLTFLNLLLQMVFFGMAVVNDLQTRKNPTTSLNKWKDIVFSVLAFPVGMFVVLLFWIIYAYDRQLVYPDSLDAFFPLWMNHAMHTVVMPILIGEILLEPHVYPHTRNGLAALGFVGLAYLGWVMFIYLAVGLWVYPLLGLLTTSGVLGLFLFNMTVVATMYLLGRTLNYCVWGNAKMVTKRK